MSKGSPVIKVRVSVSLRVAIAADIIRLNRLPQYGAMTVSQWLTEAINEKLDHPKRGRLASRKRTAKRKVVVAGAVCEDGDGVMAEYADTGASVVVDRQSFPF